MTRILLTVLALWVMLPGWVRAQDAAAAALEGAWVVSVDDQKDRFMIVRGARTVKNEIQVEATTFGWIDNKGKPVQNWKAEIFGDTINVSFKTPGGALVNATFKADETSVIGDWINNSGKPFRFRMTRLDDEELAAMRAAAANAKTVFAKGPAIGKDSKITLVYVGADNCPSCVRFINYYGKDGKRLPEIAPELAEVRFVYVSLRDFKDPVPAKDLPEDLAWLLQPNAGGKVPMRKRGTPFFVGVVDKRVIAQGHGTAALETLVVPELKGIVQGRRAAN